jgi:hypothetical protein
VYGISDLKPTLTITDSEVSCPVLNCLNTVQRQRKSFTRKPEFHCEKHHIFISPSTFEYDSSDANILWDYDDLNEHMASKRESRIARDNSEDAVTWNVFCYLERQGLLIPYLSDLVKDAQIPLTQAKTIYWSHDKDTKQPWNPLLDARKEFEGDPSKGSEPDLIVLTDRILFFIEAKLTATNKTKPSHLNHPKHYLTGGDKWWDKAFAPGTDYVQIAEQEKKYELMRFWLLGTWMAKQLNVDFRLINLLRDADDEERDIEARFGKFLPDPSKAKFMRKTWEDICRFIQNQAPDSTDKDTMLHYFREKSVGYRNGEIQRAFAV